MKSVPRRLEALTLVIACLSGFAQTAHAQVLYGTLVGTVTDSGGALIPGASISITQQEYVGSHTVHQHTRYNINYGLPGEAAASQPFYNGTLGTGITSAETVIYPFERMNYNSLQSTLQHRFSDGSNFQAAYTWSRWMGTCCDPNGDGAPAIPIPQYSYLNYTVMPGDRTHNVEIAGISKLPFGADRTWLKSGPAATILGGGSSTPS